MSDVDNLHDRRVPWSSNPLGDLLRRLGLEEYEREIVRSVGVHLTRNRNFLDLTDEGGVAKKLAAVASGDPSADAEFGAPDLLVGVDVAARAAAIKASAYPLQEIAKTYGASEDELQHRVDGGLLLAVHRDGGWALPAFQFCAGKRIPGLSRVLCEIRDGAPLVLIEAFFTTPQSVLRDDDGRIWSPREWLAAEGDVEPVRTLAQKL